MASAGDYPRASGDQKILLLMTNNAGLTDDTIAKATASFAERPDIEMIDRINSNAVQLHADFYSEVKLEDPIEDGDISSLINILPKIFASMQEGGAIQLPLRLEEQIRPNALLQGFFAMKTSTFFYLVRPTHSVDASVPLKLGRGSSTSNALTSNSNSNGYNDNSAYNPKILSDILNSGDDFINEDELLDESDRAKSAKTRAELMCDPSNRSGKKKACANCVCGLREIQEQEEKLKSSAVTLNTLGLNEDDLQAKAAKLSSNPISSCGSCYLGDAFRCSSCPYRGLPAFKPGEQISLSALASDEL